MLGARGELGLEILVRLIEVLMREARFGYVPATTLADNIQVAGLKICNASPCLVKSKILLQGVLEDGFGDVTGYDTPYSSLI